MVTTDADNVYLEIVDGILSVYPNKEELCQGKVQVN